MSFMVSEEVTVKRAARGSSSLDTPAVWLSVVGMTVTGQAGSFS